MSQAASILANDLYVATRVRDVLPGMQEHHLLAELMDLEVPAALKPVVDPKVYAHRNFRDDEFWRQIPGYADVVRDALHDEVADALSVGRFKEVVPERLLFFWVVDFCVEFHNAGDG